MSNEKNKTTGGEHNAKIQEELQESWQQVRDDAESMEMYES